MTLILTAVSMKYAAPVADRRLTYPDGSVAEDLAFKSLLVHCRDAAFSISYAGLGEIGTERTDRWLLRLLAEMDAGKLGAKEIFEQLRVRATAAVKALPWSPDDKHLIISAAGYFKGRPFFTAVQNCENESLEVQPRAFDEFLIDSRFAKESALTNPESSIFAAAHGHDPAGAELSDRFRVLNESAFFYHGTVDAIVRSGIGHPGPICGTLTDQRRHGRRELHLRRDPARATQKHDRWRRARRRESHPPNASRDTPGWGLLRLHHGTLGPASRPRLGAPFAPRASVRTPLHAPSSARKHPIQSSCAPQAPIEKERDARS